jgi:hypothetical protein
MQITFKDKARADEKAQHTREITFKDKARADEKAQHTREYVSILRRSATP